MRILGPPSNPSIENVLSRLEVRTALFVGEMAPQLWKAAIKYNMDPVGMIAQSAYETDFGRFTGNVTPEFKNTCGLKASEYLRKVFWDKMGGDLPLAHYHYATWWQGALGHAQHLCAYVGVKVPHEELVDPRYEHIRDKWCVHWRDLGGVGSWAPNPKYGEAVEALAIQLSGR